MRTVKIQALSTFHKAVKPFQTKCKFRSLVLVEGTRKQKGLFTAIFFEQQKVSLEAIVTCKSCYLTATSTNDLHLPACAYIKLRGDGFDIILKCINPIKRRR